jgi:hypothetical protein
MALDVNVSCMQAKTMEMRERMRLLMTFSIFILLCSKNERKMLFEQKRARAHYTNKLK